MTTNAPEVLSNTHYMTHYAAGLMSGLMGKKQRFIDLSLDTGMGRLAIAKGVFESDHFRNAVAQYNDKLSGDNAKLRVLFVSPNVRLMAQACDALAKSDSFEIVPMTLQSRIRPEIVNEGWDLVVFDELYEHQIPWMQRIVNQGPDTPVVRLNGAPGHDIMLEVGHFSIDI